MRPLRVTQPPSSGRHERRGQSGAASMDGRVRGLSESALASRQRVEARTGLAAQVEHGTRGREVTGERDRRGGSVSSAALLAVAGRWPGRFQAEEKADGLESTLHTPAAMRASSIFAVISAEFRARVCVLSRDAGAEPRTGEEEREREAPEPPEPSHVRKERGRNARPPVRGAAEAVGEVKRQRRSPCAELALSLALFALRLGSTLSSLPRQPPAAPTAL